jgi:hypothetical protein
MSLPVRLRRVAQREYDDPGVRVVTSFVLWYTA